MQSFPNTPEKHEQPSILTAKAMANYRQTKRPSPPQAMIFCYQPSLFQFAKKKFKGKSINGFFGETILLKKAKNDVGVAGNFGIGAPVTAVLAEDFIAWGVQQLIIIGIAGALTPSIKAGDVVVAERAVRDEGTSHHYLPSQKYVNASTTLTSKVEKILSEQHISFKTGTTWTTDAPYRETAVEVEKYQGEGVLTVEMEAAALFAVAQYFDVQATAVFCVSDSIGNGRWQPAANFSNIQKQLEAVAEAIISGLKN